MVEKFSELNERQSIGINGNLIEMKEKAKGEKANIKTMLI